MILLLLTRIEGQSLQVILVWPQWTQDGKDNWLVHMDIAGNHNGNNIRFDLSFKRQIQRSKCVYAVAL